MAYLEWPESSRNAKKNFCFYYHVKFHTPVGGGGRGRGVVKTQSVKN